MCRSLVHHKTERPSMFGKRILGLVLAVLLLIAPNAMASDKNGKHDQNDKHDPIKVMTRNLYIGADIFRVVQAATNPSAGPLDVPMAVAQVFQTIQKTDFTERAGAIADEIKRSSPDLIGLQEVSTILEQVPGDFLAGNPTPAKDVVFDYLSILMQALEARKLKYEVAAMVSNADVELPMLAGVDTAGHPVFNDVRLIDHDVILVRKGVKVDNAIARNYSINISMPLGGATIEFTRGYAAVDAKVECRVLRFVTTHLEVGGGTDYAFSAVQAAQMHELLTVLSAETKPLLLVGDFNSAPEDVVIQSATYGLIVPPYMQAKAGGYTDATTLSKKPAHLTCCFNETVDDPEAQLYERIDHIFLGPQESLAVEKAKVMTVGDQVDDMTATGLWPSDHAGVVGAIKF